MYKKYHEKFKILDILAVTTQAHEGIETDETMEMTGGDFVTTQAHEGIETRLTSCFPSPKLVTTQAHEGIETLQINTNCRMESSNNSSP